MSLIPKRDSETDEKPAIQAVAPAVHMEALLGILERTDAELTPLTKRGMDGRTATILKEIEKSGAIDVRIDGDNIWVDVIDRKAALAVIDKLISGLRNRSAKSD